MKTYHGKIVFVCRNDGSISISDGYHTIDELYEHRHALFYAVCAAKKELTEVNYFGFASDDERAELENHFPWCSKLHHDGTMVDGYFIAGVCNEQAQVMTYHIPLQHWDKFTKVCSIRERAPEHDGHTSNDVLARLWAL